jgi:hypothetical protein
VVLCARQRWVPDCGVGPDGSDFGRLALIGFSRKLLRRGSLSEVGVDCIKPI